VAEPAWARSVGDAWELTLRVQPGARRTGVVGELGEALKIRIAAPADAGRANRALVRFLAGVLDVPRASIEIVRGTHSQSKVVRVGTAIDPRRLLA
jgi:uncharacterized protein (TIGR00251 family)